MRIIMNFSPAARPLTATGRVHCGIAAVLAAALLPAVALAQGPNGSATYYRAANGKSGAELKTALFGIISKGTVKRTYKQLWTDFKTTDKRADGKVWDMYSNATNYVFGTDQDKGSHPNEGYSYNREHSFPNSWWGGTGENDCYMYTDLFHLYPTDAFVNEKRSSYPFGETNGSTYKSSGSFSKLGASTISYYKGVVFEPNDEYKGDFARTYFYMVTRYEDVIGQWTTAKSHTLDGKKYPGLQKWQLDMLMRWAEMDPVSDKEVKRNRAVYGIQKNRNPFIDYPGLERLIWGDLQDMPFSYDDFEGALTIDGVRTEPDAEGPDADAVYNIRGQRLDNDADRLPPGVYIRHGRKFIVK